MDQSIEVPGELYTPQAKETVTVEVNYVFGCISFWDRFERESVNSRTNYDIEFVRKGWVFTDFSCRHREKPLVYKLTLFNRHGDKVRELLAARSI